MNLYVYTDGERIVGKGFSPVVGYDCHAIEAADFNRIDSELLETGIYIYRDGSVAEDSEIRMELTAAEIRTKRDELLTLCDWTQLPDAPLTNEEKSLWAYYRQALRDIPQQLGFPFNVEFPEKPNN